MKHRLSRGTRRLMILVAAFTALLAAGGGTLAAMQAEAAPAANPGHVFVINLENKGYDETWGPDSKAPYLSKTLRSQGVLLSQYYGIGHNSLTNYVAQISGQGPNPDTQADCQTFAPFVQTGTADPGQAVGRGCVYPSGVKTLADQMDSSGHSWKGYMEDMGTPCRHPAVGAVDDTQKAEVGDQYATRHNPFMYFHSVIDQQDGCARHVVDQSQLGTDLQTTATTPDLSYITPDLCDDGHDSPCVDGRPGGLASADEWLKKWVPAITSSPAFKKDGMLVITFDESDGPDKDSSACCGEGPSPNSPLPGITGLGGGRTGALVLSPFTKGGTWSSTPYNHYSLLASIEDRFNLPYLGYAGQKGLSRFGTDVFNAAN
ncbi:alkaline phosphatase family protein [Streptomyces sp. NPDC096152]|uniref:alkaline phosphatase family protein n=1 Tax=Streptomyces sp. NPDC096152 TaxID=3366078 RepID=UPI003820F3CC